MQKTPEGAVIYDADRCMGCRYCMVACPYSIPRYDWNQAVPYVRKCTLCYHRLKQGKVPACVESCPEEAAIFGDRAELLEEAHRRLAASPGKYDAQVYGEHEVGGTSVLYISEEAPRFPGCQPDMDDRPLPDRTWASLKKVPPLIVGVAGVMTGIHWIIGRRMKLALEAASEAAPKEAEAGSSTTTEQNSKEDDD
jgi:formate dehydrogenase iron-sulfur subunit